MDWVVNRWNEHPCGCQTGVNVDSWVVSLKRCEEHEAIWQEAMDRYCDQLDKEFADRLFNGLEP